MNILFNVLLYRLLKPCLLKEKKIGNFLSLNLILLKFPKL